MPNNTEIAQLFEDLANAIQLKGAKGSDKFKIGRYRKAAHAIKYFSSNISDLSKPELMAIDGIGESISDKILEFVKSGHVAKLESIKKDIPPITINEFTKLKGIGPVGAKKLWLATGAKTMNDLIWLAEHNKLTQDLIEKINFYKVASERVLLSQALQISDPIYKAIEPYCQNISYAGSILRKKDTVHDVDIIAISDNRPKVKEIFKSFADNVESEGDYKIAIYKNNLKIEIAFIEPKAWGGALFHFTGPANYNKANRIIAMQKGWLLNDKGLWNGTEQLDNGMEGTICRLLEIPHLIPELRELNINVDVIREYQVKSDFHIHSNHSDGRNSIEEIADYYAKAGFKTIAITDHGKGLRITKIKDLEKYFTDIEEVQKKYQHSFRDLKILKGIEANIDKDGNLDYEDSDLAKFDIVLAAIHFNMDLPPKEQTDRLVKAINNKYVKILAHVTCEQYGVRKPIDVDWMKIFDECVKNNVMIEFNGSESRIFLSNELIQVAKQKGVKFTFGSDSHGIPHDMLSVSLRRIQRAGLTVNDICQGESIYII